MKNGSKKIWKILGNKYFIATSFFMIWVMFFDEHNISQHIQNKQKLKAFIEQKDYYKTKIEVDKQKLEELQTNDENLEKFAREQFQMKKNNEDVFIIVEE